MDTRLEDNFGSSRSSHSTTTYTKYQNKLNLAKYTLSRLKEESYILSQDRIGFTPLVSIKQKIISYLDIHSTTVARISKIKVR